MHELKWIIFYAGVNLLPTAEEVATCWRRLHNEELHNLYVSPNIIRVIKSRIRWAGICTMHWRDEK
jgi:hypothetical protein